MTSDNEPTSKEWERKNIIAQQRIGAFIQHWAYMEYALDEVMGAALGLEALQVRIVAANISLQSKVYTANAAIDLAPLSEREKKRFKKTVNEIPNLAGDRNIAAHHIFGPTDDGDGVQFIVYKAKGKFEIPDIIWSKSELDKKLRRLHRIDETLQQLKKKVETTRGAIELLTSLSLAPTPGIASQGLAGLLFPQAQEHQNLPPLDAILQRDPQTSQAPED